MSKQSKYVISYFNIIEPNLDFLSLMKSLENNPKKDQSTIGSSNKCSILKIEARENHPNWNVYSGHFDIWGESNDKTFDVNKMKEISKRTPDKLKEINTFIVAKNGSNKNIISYKLNNPKNDSTHFLNKFKEYCDNKIEYYKEKPANIFSQIAQLEMVSSILIKMNLSKELISKQKLEEIGNKFDLNNELFNQYIEEKTWNEKSSSNTKYAKNLKEFSIKYLAWLKSNLYQHTNNLLLEYLRDEFKNEAPCKLRRIEEAVIISVFCKHAKCQIHGYNSRTSRELIIDLEGINNDDTIIEINADKRKTDAEKINHIIDQIEMLHN